MLPISKSYLLYFSLQHALSSNMLCYLFVFFFFFTAALKLEYKLLEGRDFSLLCLLIYPWPHNNAWHIAGVSEILAE